ncbi:DnaJ domain containing protein [Aphelenchoides avenae]|nr:DnaJ domain containing protein [Aphelenchus avenae]
MTSGESTSTYRVSTTRFMEVKQAYDVLRNPEKRKEYDVTIVTESVRPPKGHLQESDHVPEALRHFVRTTPGPSVSRFGHFYNPTEAMQQEERSNRSIYYMAGAVVSIIVLNFGFVRSYYDVLGVQKNATQQDIKKAFYSLAKRYHPDVVGSNKESAAKFIEIQNAYDVLRDDAKRRDYDAGMSSPFGSAYGQTSSGPYQSGYQGGYPGGSQQRPPFDRQWHWRWETGGRPGGRKTFNESDFEYIWREYQQRAQGQRDRAYEEAFQRARQKSYDDFTRRRQMRWEQLRRDFEQEKHKEKQPRTEASHMAPSEQMRQMMSKPPPVSTRGEEGQRAPPPARDPHFPAGYPSN